MKIEKYIEELKTEFPVYGDFLRFFTIRIGDMPSDMTTWLIKIGVFYEELKRIANNMLDAYVKLAFFQAGYVPLDVLEIASEEADEEKGNLKAIARDITMDLIDSLLEGESEYTTIEEYVNLENPKEGIRVMLFSFQPEVWDEEIIFGFWSEKEIDKLIERITEPVHGYNFKDMSLLIVVDPLTYRIAKDFIRKLKQELMEKLGEDIFLSTHELLRLLAIDRKKFEADWSDLREKVIEKLKEKYPFLSIHDELWRIHLAQKEIREALADLSKTELKEKDCRELIWRVSNAVEAYLGVLYHRWKNKPPEDREFGWLLNSLKSEIEGEFGEDIYNDLSFINEKRKIVDHPKPIRITIDDVIKVVRRAEIFQHLLLTKLY